MNIKKVFNTLGRLVMAESVLLLIPAIVAMIYVEQNSVSAFIITAAFAAFFGGLMTIIFRTDNDNIYAKDGFGIVALGWIIISAVGAIPFVLSGDIPNYVDAFFETVSGFTTTGASILDNVETLSKGVHFWRSFSHWLGGMGVLVLVMAVVRNVTNRSIHLMRAEMPGPIIGKLAPRAQDTAKILYFIYIALTALQVVFLLAGGMSLYEALIHSFGTAGTGGFSNWNASIGHYGAYPRIIITIFMIIFGVNFNIFYLLILRRFKAAFKSSELTVYLSIILFSIIVITWNVSSVYNSFSESLGHSSFQVASIISTTGYLTTDINAWPNLSKSILLILMFMGSCAGSTAGGLKISRFMLLCKQITKEIKHLLHPRSVSSISFEGKEVEETTLNSASAYFILYMLCFFAMFLLVSWEPFGFESNFSATASCFNNVGPFFGGMSSFASYSVFSKLVFSFAMLLGRLEIFPLIIIFSRSTWSNR